MAINMREPSLRPRRHGECIEPVDRRALERAGWRTMLDYRENHVRGRDGRLIEIQAVWIAEAERFDGTMDVASATATNSDEAWAILREDIESSRYPVVVTGSLARSLNRRAPRDGDRNMLRHTIVV
jgi:hypothetical protein